MKKILVLLVSVLFTLSSFGQSSIDYSPVNTVTQVGDTLIMKFQYFKGDGNSLNLGQFDFEYNNKLLSYISHESQAPNGASFARNNWTGYQYVPKANSDEDDMDVQYVWWRDEAGSASYIGSADWSVERITVQSASALETGQEFIKYQFKIKDKFNSGYDNYNDIIKVNWANYQESDGTQIQTTKNPSTQSLSGIEGGNAGAFVINLKTANSVKTDYSYTIKNSAGESVATGDFDESGQASISGLENNVTYTAEANLKEDATYLDEVVTVADLALVFAEAIGASSGPSGGSTTFDYFVQDIMGDVVGEIEILPLDTSKLWTKHIGNEIIFRHTIFLESGWVKLGDDSIVDLPTNSTYHSLIFHRLENDYYCPQINDLTLSLDKPLFSDSTVVQRILTVV